MSNIAVRDPGPLIQSYDATCQSADDDPLSAATPDAPARYEVEWDEDDDPVTNYAALGAALAAAGDLYRRPAYGGGLLLYMNPPKVSHPQTGGCPSV
jgi:hypothetical protein